MGTQQAGRDLIYLRICTGKHCSRGGADGVLRAVQAAVEELGPDVAVAVKSVSCQDYCDDGPILTVLPGGFTYIKLHPQAAQQIVREHVGEERPMLEHLHPRLRRKLERRMGRTDGDG